MRCYRIWIGYNKTKIDIQETIDKFIVLDNGHHEMSLEQIKAWLISYKQLQSQ